MKLRQVGYFLAICEERNFTRAARRCGVKQPSLTGAIQRLEQAIGGKLFERSSPVRLTELGSSLHPLFVRVHETVMQVQALSAARNANGRSAPSFAQIWSDR